MPHNRTFVALGAGMLWFGWFGFNGGSAVAANGQAVYASINSSVAAAAAMCSWYVPPPQSPKLLRALRINPARQTLLTCA